MLTPKYQNRKSFRLKGYDYAQAGLYFITICVQDRAYIFGHIRDGKMILNEYGNLAAASWEDTELVRDNCRIHEFIIMPNHIHGIIEIIKNKGNKEQIGTFKSPSQTIGAIIRGFKIATIKKIKDYMASHSLSHPSTGESQFAPTQFAPNNSKNSEKHKNQDTGELQFAPTQFTPTEIIKSLDYKIWQRNYYEHIIRNKKAYKRIAQYIIDNPKKWEEDKFNA